MQLLHLDNEKRPMLRPFGSSHTFQDVVIVQLNMGGGFGGSDKPPR